jgi:hypothetical protein
LALSSSGKKKANNNKILIVEDDHFGKYGYNVTMTIDGAEA